MPLDTGEARIVSQAPPGQYGNYLGQRLICRVTGEVVLGPF
jgi:hypothetical protein